MMFLASVVALSVASESAARAGADASTTEAEAAQIAEMILMGMVLLHVDQGSE
jgi:hypothetical protein